jgi:hypothetical protein
LLATERLSGSGVGGDSTGAELTRKAQDDGLVFHGRVDVSIDSINTISRHGQAG